MTNFECALAVIEKHRLGGQWTSEAVASDLLAQFGLDPAADAKDAKPSADPSLVSPDQVTADDTAMKLAADKAKASRDALDAQTKAAAAPPPPPPPAMTGGIVYNPNPAAETSSGTTAHDNATYPPPPVGAPRNPATDAEKQAEDSAAPAMHERADAAKKLADDKAAADKANAAVAADNAAGPVA